MKLFKVRTKARRTFMRPTLKWRKDLGSESVVSRTSSPPFPEDGPLDGLDEFLVTKTVDDWVDQWCQYRVDDGKCPVKGQRIAFPQAHIHENDAAKKDENHSEMQGTCGEGLRSPSCCFYLQYSTNDSSIRNHNKEEGDKDDECIDGKVHKDISGRVLAGQAQERWKVTEDVLNFIIATERELGDQDDFRNGTQEATSPTGGSHLATECWGHN